MIKRIGTAAREELERFFATKVFLDLHVRVKTEWREDDRVLRRSCGLTYAATESRRLCTVTRLLNAAPHHRRADSQDLQAR